MRSEPDLGCTLAQAGAARTGRLAQLTAALPQHLPRGPHTLTRHEGVIVNIHIVCLKCIFFILTFIGKRESSHSDFASPMTFCIAKFCFLVEI